MQRAPTLSAIALLLRSWHLLQQQNQPAVAFLSDLLGPQHTAWLPSLLAQTTRKGSSTPDITELALMALAADALKQLQASPGTAQPRAQLTGALEQLSKHHQFQRDAEARLAQAVASQGRKVNAYKELIEMRQVRAEAQARGLTKLAAAFHMPLQKINSIWSAATHEQRASAVLVLRFEEKAQHFPHLSSPTGFAAYNKFLELLLALIVTQGSAWKQSTAHLEAAVNAITPEQVEQAFQQAKALTNSPSTQPLSNNPNTGSNSISSSQSGNLNPQDPRVVLSFLKRIPTAPSKTQEIEKTISFLTQNNWRIEFDSEIPQGRLIANMDRRVIFINELGNFDYAKTALMLERAADIVRLKKVPPIEVLSQRFPEIKWNKLNHFETAAVSGWVKDISLYGSNVPDFMKLAGRLQNIVDTEDASGHEYFLIRDSLLAAQKLGFASLGDFRTALQKTDIDAPNTPINSVQSIEEFKTFLPGTAAEKNDISNLIDSLAKKGWFFSLEASGTDNEVAFDADKKTIYMNHSRAASPRETINLLNYLNSSELERLEKRFPSVNFKSVADQKSYQPLESFAIWFENSPELTAIKHICSMYGWDYKSTIAALEFGAAQLGLKSIDQLHEKFFKADTEKLKFAVNYPTIEFGLLTNSKQISALTLWVHNQFQEGLRTPNLRAAAKTLGFADVDALQVAMQAPQTGSQAGFVNEAEWAALGIADSNLQTAWAQLTPDSARVVKALLTHPERAFSNPKALETEAASRFGVSPVLTRVAQQSGLKANTALPALQPTATQFDRGVVAFLSGLKGRVSADLQGRIDLALQRVTAPPKDSSDSVPPAPANSAATEQTQAKKAARQAKRAAQDAAEKAQALERQQAAQAKREAREAQRVKTPATVTSATPPSPGTVPAASAPAVEPPPTTPAPSTDVIQSATPPTELAPSVTVNTPAAPPLKLAADILNYERAGIEATPLSDQLKADAADLVTRLDQAETERGIAPTARLQLTPVQAIALALYRKNAVLTRNTDGTPNLKPPLQNMDVFNREFQALHSFLGVRNAAQAIELLKGVFGVVLQSAAADLKTGAASPGARALVQLERWIGAPAQALQASSSTAADVAKQTAVNGLNMLAQLGALDAAEVQRLRTELQAPDLGPTLNATNAQWSLPEVNLRQYPYNTPSAAQQVRERQSHADALVKALGATRADQAGAADPDSFIFKVGLRALREGHGAGVAQLMREAWRTGQAPSEAVIRQQLFPDVEASPAYVQAVVKVYVAEVQASLAFAMRVRAQQGAAGSPLTPAQAAAALRIADKAEDALTGGAQKRDLISLPQATDNRAAVVAALNQLGPQVPQGVFIWSTSPYLATGVVAEEAQAALGARFEIVHSIPELLARMSQLGRIKPLLLIMGDGEGGASEADMAALLQRLGPRNSQSTNVVYVADEAHRLGTAGTLRASTLKPLVDRADVSVAMTSTLVGRDRNSLGRLLQWLNLLPAGELPANLSLQYSNAAPHFFSASAQRSAPVVSYVAVPYSAAGFKKSRAPDIQNDHHAQAQQGLEDKLPLLEKRVQDRVRRGGKVIIGSTYKEKGVDLIALALSTSGPNTLRVGKLDAALSAEQRRDVLRRFKLAQRDAQALDVLVTTFGAVRGDTAVDVRTPPAGGFEVMLANLPGSQADIDALTGLVNQEALSTDVPVRITVPFMRYTGDQLRAGAPKTSREQDKLNELYKKNQEAAVVTGAQQADIDSAVHESQLARFTIWRDEARGLESTDLNQVWEFLQINAMFQGKQQAVHYLVERVAERAGALKAKGVVPSLLDLGAGDNALVRRVVRAQAVDQANAYGLDRIPTAWISGLVSSGKLPPGSDLNYLGDTLITPASVQAALPPGKKFNIVTASFSFNSKDPQEIKGFFAAAAQTLAPEGRLIVMQPLAAFDPTLDTNFDKGLRALGLRRKRDRVLLTVGSSVRYLEFERDPAVTQPDLNVDSKLFRYGG
jgi:hypothetical protein